VLVSGTPPVRAKKLQYYADHNFLARCLPAPALAERHYRDVPKARGDDWSGQTRTPHKHLEKAWFELVAPASAQDERPSRSREATSRRTREKEKSAANDLPLFAWTEPQPDADSREAAHQDALDRVVTFPGLRL
jgi:type IV secretion system protein VirD4